MLQVGARIAAPPSVPPARAGSPEETCLRIAADGVFWEGFELVDGRPEALAANEHRLSFADGSVAAIYLDRVLEFLDLADGARLLRECRRVLARGGRLRVVRAMRLKDQRLGTLYLHADMAMKEKALARATKSGVAPKRYRPTDRLLAFLEGL